MQKLASSGDVCLAVGVGEQPVVTDAVKARRQHVQQEAAHELVGGQAHSFVARASMFAVVLPAEGDAAIVQGDEPGVGDRDPVGISGKVREYRLGSGERTLGVDHPLALAQRHEPVGEGVGVGQIHVIAEALELTRAMSALQFFEEGTPEQARQPRTERKNPGLHDTHRSASGARPPPGTMPCTCGW